MEWIEEMYSVDIALLDCTRCQVLAQWPLDQTAAVHRGGEESTTIPLRCWGPIPVPWVGFGRL